MGSADVRAILTWHSIDPSGSPISLSPAEFRRQVAWLRSGRTRVVSVEELLQSSPDADAVALTFDDGFANFATEAAPLLLQEGFPVTVFVVTDHVGRDNRWGGRTDGVPVLSLMDWETLGRLQDAGVTLGAHTRTHPHLTAAATDLRDELLGAADTLERRAGTRPAGFAYPYGDVDARVSAAVAGAYEWACTTEFSSLSDGSTPVRLPRLDAWYLRDDRWLDRWGTPPFHAWVWGRRQGRSARAAWRRLTERT